MRVTIVSVYVTFKVSFRTSHLPVLFPATFLSARKVDDQILSREETSKEHASSPFLSSTRRGEEMSRLSQFVDPSWS